MNLINSAKYHFLFFLLYSVLSPMMAGVCHAEGLEDELALSLFNRDSYSLIRKLYILNDPKVEVSSVEHARELDRQGYFKKNEKKYLNFGVLRHEIWIRFDVNYPASYPNELPKSQWVLETGAALMAVGELYEEQDDGSFSMASSDIRTPFDEREINHVSSTFPLEFKLGEEKRFYLRLRVDGAFYMPAKIWKLEAFTTNVAAQEFIFGLFYGAMLCIIAFNFLIYLSVRDVSYVYYIVYLIAITLLFLIERGHGVNFIDNSAQFLERNKISTLIWINLIAVIAFIRTFLRTKQNNPFIDSLYKTCMKLAVIYIVIDIFIDHSTSLIWSVFVTQLILLTFFPIAIYLYLKGNEDAKFFGIAWGFNIFALLIYCSIAIDVLPSEPILLAMAPLGILSEAILLSLALAERLKRTQRNLIDADKRAMAQLSRYQSVFNNALEGIYQLSLEGRFISVNPAMARFLGYRDSEEVILAGRSAVSLCYQQPENQYRELSKNRYLKEEISFRNIAGSEAWADHSAKLILDESGNPLHIEGTLVDITDRKLRERAYREREQERLENSLAKETAAAKSEFLAKMSHEIRTSLTSIIGLSEAIKDLQLTGSEREDSVKTIAHSSQELLGLINNILDYSKIEAGKLLIESIAVDFECLLAQLAESFRFKAENKGLTFETLLHRPFPKQFLSDPTRLNQILGCIVGNAIENTKAGSISISCAWSKIENELTVTVKDTGTGITQETIESLFIVFTQTAADEIRQYGNTGLGLPIAKELALLMGGDISVHSEIGYGSEFIVRLSPKLPAHVQWIDHENVDQQLSGRKESSAEIPLLHGNLLLAEDNPVNQKLVEKIVSKTGLRVITVSNGRQALDIVLEEQIDVILMDINMPEMNGLEATQYLREQGFDMPIFALTAETDQIEIERALDIGCDGYLQKPVDKDALYQTLAELLSNSGARH